MVKSTKNPIGTPMGFKLIASDVDESRTLEKYVDLFSAYHGGKYIVGYDSQLCDSPHYHIHWHSIKEISENAKKTFRAEIKKAMFISNASKLYFGKDIPDADPECWLAYAVKEQQVLCTVDVSDGFNSKIGTQLEIKKLKKIKSQSIESDKKVKEEFKDKLFAFVKENLALDYNGNLVSSSIREAIVMFLLKEEKYGSLQPRFIRQYELEYMIKVEWAQLSSLEKARKVLNNINI